MAGTVPANNQIWALYRNGACMLRVNHANPNPLKEQMQNMKHKVVGIYKEMCWPENQYPLMMIKSIQIN